MILCVANLICPDYEPLAMATRFSAAEARALLLHTKAVALVHGERWSHASLGGTGFRQGDADPAGVGILARIHALAGVSLSIAPLAGLGYWHKAGTAGDEWRDVQRRVADERDIVVDVAEHCRNFHNLPLVAMIDSTSEWKEAFELSFRRRIAYALGFHASLRTGSLDCYDAWYEPLIVGTLAQLDPVASSGDELDGFSLLLNLLSRLHGTMAYEQQHQGVPDPRAPGRVLFQREKVARLESQLANVSRRLKLRLNADGRIALRSLLFQLRSERDGGFWNVDSSPIWGMGSWPQFTDDPA